MISFLTFIFIVAGTDYGLSAIDNAAWRSSGCDTSLSGRLVKQYRPEHVERQIEVRINNEFKRAFGNIKDMAEFRLEGKQYVMRIKGEWSSSDLISSFPSFAKLTQKLYCGEASELKYARAFGFSVQLNVEDKKGVTVFQSLINEDGCSQNANRSE